MTDKLWESVKLGHHTLSNRLVMAPMTRSRAKPDGSPTELNAEYYAQRASMGLLITEGTQPSEDGQGYLTTPGIFSDAQVAGWKLVTDRVHAAGGRIFLQMMHVGRIAHPSNTPHGRQPVAPSAVKPAGQMFTMHGPQEMPVPRELTTAEVAATVRDYRFAAKRAIEAGLDGVEVHAANGYLIHQFLASNTNLRTDAYGGSIANRIRFAVEVATEVAEEIGPERTGVHISPGNPFNDIVENDTPELYRALVVELAKLGLAYLHPVHRGDDALLQWFRQTWPTVVIVNRPDRPREQIARDIDAGTADMASVARFSLANSDLVARLKNDAPLNEPDPNTFYGGDAKGYTDYPTLAAVS